MTIKTSLIILIGPPIKKLSNRININFKTMNTITIKNEGHEEDFNNLRDVISYYSCQDREVSFSNIEIHNLVCGAVYNMKKKNG